MVARTDGHDVPEDAACPLVGVDRQGGLGHENDRVLVLDMIPNSILEDEGVIVQVKAREDTLFSPSGQFDILGLARR